MCQPLSLLFLAPTRLMFGQFPFPPCKTPVCCLPVPLTSSTLCVAGTEAFKAFYNTLTAVQPLVVQWLKMISMMSRVCSHVFPCVATQRTPSMTDMAWQFPHLLRKARPHAPAGAVKCTAKCSHPAGLYFVSFVVVLGCTQDFLLYDPLLTYRAGATHFLVRQGASSPHYPPTSSL